MSVNAIPDKYRSDHLFITVGTNPLPNYVSAMLLSKKSSTIYLLHSDGLSGAPSTQHFAYFLQNVLVEKGFSKKQIVLSGISEADGEQIEEQMKELLDEEGVSGKVGLDNTGGTKPMSVHTYRVLEEEFPKGTFSYLDARKLAMRIKGVRTTYPVAGAVHLTLEQLSALHGYTLARPRKTPQHKVLFRALAQVHAAKEGYNQWKKWLDKKNRPLSTLPDPAVYPALQGVLKAMDILCGGTATPELLAQKLGFNELDSGFKWLNSTWLEELVLEAIEKNAKSFGIKSYGIGLKPKPSKGLLRVKKPKKFKPKDFDLDVAGMIGYQLFAISCIVRDQAGGETKKHLFEAYMRARQLGGDEARVALVCCVPNVDIVQAEIERKWHVSQQIRVFGRNDLIDLDKKFREWFKNATS